MFFARNTFTIKISARAHHPVSLKPPLIFRPLGLPHCLYLLRDLRQIELEVNIDDRSAYATTRHRARIQHSVDIIKQYAQDKVRKFLLKPHDVDAQLLHCVLEVRQRESATSREKDMFVLERLSEISGIEEVKLVGVPSWFKRCLEMRITGEGGALEK
ncbi:hypothetical protein EKO04_007825 [Ascochyta lentis]|uniref:Uncharacterized protein n=1 Tax=Ascochyta lentis TaxID=205686 RepID=A0A8H7J2E5_9PLEO|nr:hypothetical protein EKO04_007825 [Ascochyta lentis]